tara:strand:- start:4904 stop:5449 length:546 start_codon:yes stop_codon:yes gene_type:complete
MNKILLFLILILNQNDIMSQSLVYDFNTQSKQSDWVIVNDDVMGGLSSSQIRIDEIGNGVFEGSVSTTNNGGFSSVRLNLENIPVKKNSYFKIRLKGDNKNYQFRIKKNKFDNYSYVAKFKTDSEWETIIIPVTQMYPYFRGMKLDMNNFNYNYFQQITFLIGNNKNEKFKLMIDSIELID